MQDTRAEQNKQNRKQKPSPLLKRQLPHAVDQTVSGYLSIPPYSASLPCVYHMKTKKTNATPPSSSAVTTPGGASLIAPATTMGLATAA
jgi:hypothetical protein